ncbi:MAG: NADPH-dependent 7-cyano-7-deazaguanine reductase QueF [Rickettsiales bacterium]|jgi:7-cyano-7-deazaguanine reductase|nr:NADPH-dependent 7-cyano-7-deazaguanine reductase QueF [Rickettsiales bacterium]
MSDNLNSLGKQSNIPSEPNVKILESVNNPHIDTLYTIRLTCPEFTSICPITGQPDFAHITIDYIPSDLILESKSLKLYLFSYRNHGAFHEDCTIQIAKDIVLTTKPKWIRIAGLWYPRGGIPIDIFYQSGSEPKDCYIPSVNTKDYQARN